MSVLDIADEIALFLEPDPTLRDDARAEPIVLAADMLYLWPESEVFGAEDTGQTDREIFSISLIWATDSTYEQGTEQRDRDVTERIIAKADEFASLVRGNRAGATFEWLQVDDIDYESVSTHEVRGFRMGLSGYIYRAD